MKLYNILVSIHTISFSSSHVVTKLLVFAEALNEIKFTNDSFSQYSGTNIVSNVKHAIVINAYTESVVATNLRSLTSLTNTVVTNCGGRLKYSTHATSSCCV